MLSKIFIATFLMTIALSASGMGALEAMHPIASTRHHTVSSTLLQRDLQLLVSVPPGAQADVVYPTVYLLDGGAFFPMLTSYYNYLRFEDTVPELILVGISYGSDNFEGGNYRSTDFTAPSAERDYWGGAARFQQVLEQELMPLIEKTYPSNPKNRILFGQSLGGQFVVFSAFTKPELFTAHIASNPALHRNLDYFKGLTVNNRAGSTKLLVVSGSEDFPEYAEPRKAWIEHQSANKPDLDLGIETIEGYGHFSLAPEAFRRGLARFAPTGK